ncbi:hypothetical protein AU194_20915 [Mycobacterium sp. GA-2829]|nr:hypothetical protein AU194_20915 [Mycobacterium sp. GA-2829]
MNPADVSAADAPTIAAEDEVDDDTSEKPTSAAKAPMTERRWVRTVAYVILPVLVMAVALVGAYAKWQDATRRAENVARVESVQAAREAAVAMLSYRPESVEPQLDAAGKLMTNQFRESYSSLVRDVVIPGAKKDQISATAKVAAVAPVSADRDHAVLVVYVNQTTTIGADPPTDTTSVVRVTLDKVDGRWLVAGFDPV